MLMKQQWMQSFFSRNVRAIKNFTVRQQKKQRTDHCSFDDLDPKSNSPVENKLVGM